jgi:hypothetical protein
MRVEITEQQYQELKGSGIQLEVEKRYYIQTGLKKKSIARRRPTDKLKLSDVDLTNITAQQKLAYRKVQSILGNKRVMRGDRLGRLLAEQLKCSRDMGSYYVSELVKLGGLVIVDD